MPASEKKDEYGDEDEEDEEDIQRLPNKHPSVALDELDKEEGFVM